MYEQSVHSRNLLKFVEIYIVNYCIIICCKSLLMKNCCESFVIKIRWRICWMNVVNNHLNMLLKIYHLIMMKMWWRCDEVLYQNCCDEVVMKFYIKIVAMNNLMKYCFIVCCEIFCDWVCWRDAMRFCKRMLK